MAQSTIEIGSDMEASSITVKVSTDMAQVYNRLPESERHKISMLLNFQLGSYTHVSKNERKKTWQEINNLAQEINKEVEADGFTEDNLAELINE